MKNFQCFKPTNSQHTLNFHPLTTQYFPTLTNIVEIQAQEIHADHSVTICGISHLTVFGKTTFAQVRGTCLVPGKGYALGDALLGHLDHWLRLTRQQKGAHLNNYEIDLGNDNTGGNQKDL